MFYDLIPLPREFGYLGIGFGVSYHSYLSTTAFPIRDSITIFIVSYQWDKEPSCYGSHNTGHSYSLHEGLLTAVVIIPSSVTSEARDCLLR